jgi:long-chain acyl-CoA synthetase
MVGVPALWQMLERRIVARAKEQGPAAAMAFDWALELNRMLGKNLGLDMGRLFFGTVHEGLGGNVRHLISGGAALPRSTAKLFAGLGLTLSEGYGLTEAAPVLTIAKSSPRLKPGQVGKPVPGVEIKIAEPDASGVGEVWARGPNVMLGYAGDPEGTARVLDADGWLHTGDLGKLDKKKQLVLVGRMKDVIVSASGENCYPDDVENLLGNIHDIKEVAIVGIADPRGGERVACLAVPTVAGDEENDAGARAKRHERALKSLREALAKLPRSAQPAVVHLWDAELPRTATRKVKRSEARAIVERLVAASTAPVFASGEVSGSAAGARHAIAAIAGKGDAVLHDGTSLRADLGFDSLMAMELLTALEAQTGRTLDSDALARAETVGDIERLVADAGGDLSLAHPVEEKEEEPIRLPEPLAEAAKSLLTRAQMGFYDKVMRPRVYGRAHLPYNRNTIVASNHTSHLDMGFVKYALGSYGDGIVSLAAQDYFFEGNKWRRAYFENLTNLAPFDRKGGLRTALRQAGDILDAGKTVLLFPEGTRSPDGAVHEFKPIIGYLALTHGVDILPVYLGGTYEALPKGRSVPIKREITARIGKPLEVSQLRRLTEGMKPSLASRKVAELAHLAVCALRDGTVLDLEQLANVDAMPASKEHPLVTLFRELERKYVSGSVPQPITYYFTLGTETEAKWTLRIGPEGCEAHLGKPTGAQADCVLKTTPEIFTKIVREAYTPSPMEFMTGLVKSNDIGLLQTFQKAFDLA